jgi:hypothetical protein
MDTKMKLRFGQGKIIILLLISILSLSCERIDPNAYNRDPLYQYLIAQIAIQEALKKQVQANITENLKNEKNTNPHGPGRSLFRERIAKHRMEEVQIDQKIKYLNAKMVLRARQAQEEYLLSRKRKEYKYPNDEALQAFKLGWEKKVLSLKRKEK